MFFDVDAVSDRSNPLPHMFPDAGQFGRDVGALGIGNGDTVVVYNSGGWVAAPRAWWMFLSFGHDNVRVLNGGLKKWVAEGRKVEGGQVTAKPATFKASFDARRVRGVQQMIGNVASRAEQVIDARASERYQGKAAKPGRAFAQATSRAVSTCRTTTWSTQRPARMKSLEEMRAAFLGAGVNSKPRS